MLNLKETSENIDCIKEREFRGEKLYWIADDWKNDKFQSFLDNVNSLHPIRSLDGVLLSNFDRFS